MGRWVGGPGPARPRGGGGAVVDLGAGDGIAVAAVCWVRRVCAAGVAAVATASGAVVVAAVLVALRPEHWFVACWCAFLATSPDLMWFSGFWKARSGAERSIPTYLLARLHASIQWFQRPIGAVVELAWGMSMVYLIANLI